jgi:DNA polymerase-3 subunit delta
MSVYLLWGEDDFRLEKALISLRSKVLGDEISPLNHRILKNPEMNILIENIQTTGMMFGNLLIEIHSKNIFVRSKEKDEELEEKKSKSEFLDKIIDTLEYLPPCVSVVFICELPKNSKKKVDGASKIVKAIKKIGEIQEFQAFKNWETQKFTEWIIQNAKEKNLSLKSDVAQELLISVGEDLRQLDNEINKLELLAFPEKIITKKMVADLGLSCDNIFNFADLLICDDKQKTYEELDKLLQKEEPLRILGFLQSTIRQWLNIKVYSKTMTPFEISKKINKHEYIVKLTIQKLAKISANDLIALQKRVTETEFKIKSGKLEKKLALELLV